MEYQSQYFVDRKFRLLLEGAVFFAEQAAGAGGGKWTPQEGAFARASIMHSVLLLEAASNAVIGTINLSKAYFADIDRMAVLSKFEYYLQLCHPEKKMDRGSLLVQQAQELVNLRNLIVHPRPFTSEWTKQDERTYQATLGETQFLKLPKSFVVLKHEHALVALKAAMSFLNHFFRDLCEYSDETVCAMLTSDRPYPPPKYVVLAHDPRYIQWHDKWGIDIDFLIDVKEVKKAEARFREHLKKQAAAQDADAEQST